MSKRRALLRLQNNARALSHLYRACAKLGMTIPNADPPLLAPEVHTLERIVERFQSLADDALPWRVSADGWPGRDTLCAVWSVAPPSREDVITHALSLAEGEPVLYRLGAGADGAGEWLQPLHRFDEAGDGEDCSSFVAACLGRRKAGGPDWRNSKGQQWWCHTGSIYHDATGPNDLFVAIPEPVRGCVFTYPDAGGKQGHTGIVIAADGDLLRIIDCSSSQSRRHRDAIRQRDGAWLYNKRSRGLVFADLKAWHE